MDLETENRLAAILMKEAAELRRQADEEGVLAYLRKPNVRTRPNSRFLTATVLGVQQANRAVEVKEMWKVRQKELELDKGHVRRSRDGSSSNKRHIDIVAERTTVRHNTAETNYTPSCSSTRAFDSCEGGLRDEELEEFLRSRTKRGRGDIGPRMDETGPYLSPCTDDDQCRSLDVRLIRKVYGPDRPPSMKSNESSEDERRRERRKKRSKKVHSSSSEEKQHSKKHKSKNKSKNGKSKSEKKSRRYD